MTSLINQHQKFYSTTNIVMKPEQNVKHQEGLSYHSLSDSAEASGVSGSRPARWLSFSYRRRLLMHAPFGELHDGSRYHAVAARRFSSVKGLSAAAKRSSAVPLAAPSRSATPIDTESGYAFGTVVELCHTCVDGGSQAHRLGR